MTHSMLNIDHLRSLGVYPRWFGLGFIQIDIDPGTRMNVWHPELTQSTPVEEFHDHRRDFGSAVLLGEMTHELAQFQRSSEGDFELCSVSCDRTNPSPPVVVCRGRIRTTASFSLAAGSTYALDRNSFHRVRADKAVTLQQLQPKVRETARILRPIATGSFCPFSNPIAEDLLWDYIADVLGKPGYHMVPIAKGVLGETSKIVEEALEMLDASQQGSTLMELVEAADLYGALEAWLSAKHPGIPMAEIAGFSSITKRAFENGHR